VRAVFLDRHAIVSSPYNATCPIKLLLANAIRHENVHGHTIDEVFEHTAKSISPRHYSAKSPRKTSSVRNPCASILLSNES
jgi:hypothetical protein